MQWHRIMGPQRRVVAVLQARTGSTRLPGKVLLPLGGRPMLHLIVERVRGSRALSELVIATTTDSRDDAIGRLAGELGVGCFRGSEEDCLDRYYQAARQSRADVVVRLTGDNPLVDGDFVDWVVGRYRAADPACDYADTSISKTFPLGLSVEVFSFEALATAWREDDNPAWREHVTPFIYRQPHRFRTLHLASPEDFSRIRATVDTPEDLIVMRHVYEHFGNRPFSWRDAVALLQSRPEWLSLNRAVPQKVV